jgi:hypothetical protein
MHGSDNARPGGSPGAGATQSWLVNGAHPTAERAHRQQARCIHELGPRALGEMLREIERDPMDVRRIVEKYAEIDPEFVAAVGARDWIRPTAVIRTVRRVGP